MHLLHLQAPRPSSGPHKLRESLPLIVFLRNRLKYALTHDEVKKIVMQRLIKVDGKVRTDMGFPAGFMGNLIGVDCKADLYQFWVLNEISRSVINKDKMVAKNIKTYVR